MRECPTCHRPFAGAGNHRLCFACGRPILRGHKWHAAGCYMVHDDCQNPTLRVLFKPGAERASAPTLALEEAES